MALRPLAGLLVIDEVQRRLERLYLVHAGTRTFDLAPAVRAVAFGNLLDDLPPLG